MLANKYINRYNHAHKVSYLSHNILFGSKGKSLFLFFKHAFIEHTFRKTVNTSKKAYLWWESYTEIVINFNLLFEIFL